MGSGGLGRALNGTCALSGPARAIAGAATVVTALLGSRRCHRQRCTYMSHPGRNRKSHPFLHGYSILPMCLPHVPLSYAFHGPHPAPSHARGARRHARM